MFNKSFIKSIGQNEIIRKSGYYFPSICLIHCLATPIILFLIPALSGFFSPTIEIVLILAVVPASMLAFFPTWIHHKNTRLLYIYISGLIFIIISRLMGHEQYLTIGDVSSASILIHSIPSTVLMISGLFLVSYAVYKNNNHTHTCNNSHHH